MLGEQYSKWTVTGEESVMVKGSSHIMCRCECGRERLVSVGNLKHGRTHSCNHCAQKHTPKRHTHEMSKEPIYRLWTAMKRRCNNPHSADYVWYGERGIKVAPVWSESFEAFRDWAFENGYAKGLQLNRIDNNGDYGPSNCEFVTPKQNSRNRRSTRYLSMFGETKPAAAWAEDGRCRVTPGAFYSRLSRGWPPEYALITPALDPVRWTPDEAE